MKTNYSLIHGNVVAWMVTSLKLDDQGLQCDPHLIDLPNWPIRFAMAHVQHPKDLFKAIARENTPKEGDCARPGGLPVVLKLGEVDDAHVENKAKKPCWSIIVTGLHFATLTVVSAYPCSQASESALLHTYDKYMFLLPTTCISIVHAHTNLRTCRLYQRVGRLSM